MTGCVLDDGAVDDSFSTRRGCRFLAIIEDDGLWCAIGDVGNASGSLKRRCRRLRTTQNQTHTTDMRSSTTAATAIPAMRALDSVLVGGSVGLGGGVSAGDCDVVVVVLWLIDAAHCVQLLEEVTVSRLDSRCSETEPPLSVVVPRVSVVLGRVPVGRWGGLECESGGGRVVVDWVEDDSVSLVGRGSGVSSGGGGGGGSEVEPGPVSIGRSVDDSGRVLGGGAVVGQRAMSRAAVGPGTKTLLVKRFADPGIPGLRKERTRQTESWTPYPWQTQGRRSSKRVCKEKRE